MLLKKNKKKSLVTTQEDLNSRLVSANQALMTQMENQQERDLSTTLQQQKAQRQILRQIMGE